MSDASMPIHPVTGVAAIGIGKRGPIWPIIGGSGEGDGNTGASGGESGKTPEPAAKPEPKPFVAPSSQEELDRIIGARVAREADKYKDYAELKEKAGKFEAAEDEKRSDLEKAQKRAEKAEKERDDLKAEKAHKELAESVADAKRVPAGLLVGATREEMEAHADKLLTWNTGNTGAGGVGSRPNFQQGNPSQDGKKNGRKAGYDEAVRRGFIKPDSK